MLEAMIDGKYYWVPFMRIQSVQTEPPTDLRDFVWTAAQFVWTNGGKSPGFVPTRYPGSERSANSGVRLSRKTEWTEEADHLVQGLGQRILMTDESATEAEVEQRADPDR